jgi:signal peptidase II
VLVAPRRRSPIAVFGILVAVAAAVLLLDQLAKAWVIATLPSDVPRPILGSLLVFRYVRNSGAAFSLATGSTWVFSIIAAAVVVFLIWFARRIRSLAWAALFGLLLGGTLGNLTDRLFRAPGFGVGRVVDFIQIPLLPAIFNLADSAIVTSMVLFVLLTLRGTGLDGARHGGRPQG